VLDTSVRLQTRFALQIYSCSACRNSAWTRLVPPWSTVPPRKLTAPRESNANGRSPIGWSLIGQQGFPAITVPAGFTTEVWDRMRDEKRRQPAWSVLSKLTCPWASTSLRGRLTRRCCSGSPRLLKRQPGIENRRRTSDRYPVNRDACRKPIAGLAIGVDPPTPGKMAKRRTQRWPPSCRRGQLPTTGASIAR